MKKITKIDELSQGKLPNTNLRVAAYARVSTDSDEQLENLKAQREHYERYIKSNPEWEFAGLYYDEGISGTKMATGIKSSKMKNTSEMPFCKRLLL